MKILILTRSYDQNVGGMESHTRTLVEHFIDNGWDVTIATPDLKDEKPLFFIPGATVLRIGKAPNPVLKYSLSFWLKIRQLLTQHADEYDAICNIGMSLSGSFVLPIKIRDKIVTIFHGTYVLERGTLLARIKNNGPDLFALLGIPYTFIFSLLQQSIINRSRKVISVSAGIANNLVELYDLPKAKSVIIPNFVDTETFAYKKRKIHKPVHLLFLSRIHTEKGIMQLLGAIGRLKQTRTDIYQNIRCSVAGDGPDMQAAIDRANVLGLGRVTFLGNASRQDIPGILRNADIFIFPSLRNEGLPLAILEAMSTGLPCIASDVPGVNEIVKNNRTGLLCKKGNVADLSDKIAQLVSQPEQIIRLGSAARQRVEQNHDMRRALQKFDDVFVGVTNSNKTPGQKHWHLPAYWLAYGLVALGILLPLLSAGFVLTLDMVFTPKLRAPADVNNNYLLQELLHALNYLLPGQVIEKLLLFIILLLAGVGMHRLSRHVNQNVSYYDRVGSYFAGILYMINPFTYDRFMAGQYDVLLGYTLLPWFTRALLRFLARPRPGTTLNLSLWSVTLSIVSIHSIGYMFILGVIGVGLSLWRNRSNTTWIVNTLKYISLVLITFLVLSSYWLIPLVFGHNTTASTISRIGYTDQLAFATTGNGWIGKSLNLLGLQGFWAEATDMYKLPQSIAPDWGILTLTILLLVITGIIKLWRIHRRAIVVFFVSVLLVAVILALGTINSWLTAHLPFFAGYREPEKFATLIALLYAVFAGYGVSVWLRFCREQGSAFFLVLATILLLLLPIVWTPTMFWGFNRQLEPVDYPADWYTMNQLLDRDHSNFQTLFLPWHLYMYFDFAGRDIANPAPMFFDKPMIVNDNPEFKDISLTNPTSAKEALNKLLPAANRESTLGEQLVPLHIKYILLAQDDDYLNYAYLDKQSDIKLIASGATLKLYLNEAWRGK